MFEGSEDETVIRYGYNVLGIMFLFIFFSVKYGVMYFYNECYLQVLDDFFLGVFFNKTNKILPRSLS